MNRIIKGIIVLIFSISAIFAVELPFAGEQQVPKGEISVIPSPVEMEKELDPESYIVGVGDQFLVENVHEQSIFTLPVLPTGEISIPGVAKVKVAGKPLSIVLNDIQNEAGAYSIVTLYNIKNLRVPVTGAVLNPGIYSISASWRLSDLLRMVPMNQQGKDFAIEIRSEENSRTVNIYDFYVKGDMSANPYLHAGESIFIPYADIMNECISVYGPIRINTFVSLSQKDLSPTSYTDTVSSVGLIPFVPGETLGDFQRRKVQLSENVDHQNILVVRDGKNIFISGNKIDSFQLEAGDRVEFATLSRVIVSGHVNEPGSFSFIPGHTVMDYISMAGGVNEKGSNKSAIIIRGDKRIKKIDDIEIQRGDIILVNRSLDDILIGETSVLQFISMLASITATLITAYIASGS